MVCRNMERFESRPIDRLADILALLTPLMGLARVQLCGLLLALLLPLSSYAGELVIHNMSPRQSVCHVDGYTKDTGWPVTWDVTLDSGAELHVSPSYKRAAHIIDWVECNGLRTRMMHITPEGFDGLVVLNGQQNRVLNVTLYPCIPSDRNGNFRGLLLHVINMYQAMYPQVLLNLVMSENVDIYSASDLPILLGPSGYDVAELDTLYIGFLASKGLIAPAKITGDRPLPVAIAGSTYEGTLYGVPSWLCMDFLFSFSPELKSVKIGTELLAFLASMPRARPELIGNYNGSWRLPGLYINAYVQTYGYEGLPKALALPPDPLVIRELVACRDLSV